MSHSRVKPENSIQVCFRNRKRIFYEEALTDKEGELVGNRMATTGGVKPIKHRMFDNFKKKRRDNLDLSDMPTASPSEPEDALILSATLPVITSVTTFPSSLFEMPSGDQKAKANSPKKSTLAPPYKSQHKHSLNDSPIPANSISPSSPTPSNSPWLSFQASPPCTLGLANSTVELPPTNSPVRSLFKVPNKNPGTSPDKLTSCSPSSSPSKRLISSLPVSSSPRNYVDQESLENNKSFNEWLESRVQRERDAGATSVRQMELIEDLKSQVCTLTAERDAALLESATLRGESLSNCTDVELFAFEKLVSQVAVDIHIERRKRKFSRRLQRSQEFLHP